MWSIAEAPGRSSCSFYADYKGPPPATHPKCRVATEAGLYALHTEAGVRERSLGLEVWTSLLTLTAGTEATSVERQVGRLTNANTNIKITQSYLFFNFISLFIIFFAGEVVKFAYFDGGTGD